MSEQITIPAARVGAYVVTLPLEAVKVGNRFRQDYGDIDALADSIEAIGLLQPIGVDRGHNLIFGHRRYLAHLRLGRETIQARIIEVPSLLQAEHDENELRKAFTTSERVAIAKAIEDTLKATERRGRTKADTGQADLIEPENPQNFAELSGNESRQIAAEKAGFGNPETYRQARTVTDEAIPELVEAMDKGDIAISTAAKLVGAGPEVQREAVANPKEAPAIAQFAEKIVNEWEYGNLTAAIALTHNYTDTAWFHRLANACDAICFTRGRIGFVNPEGKKAAPTQGQTFFYFGDDAPSFCAEFRRIGLVVEVRQ